MLNVYLLRHGQTQWNAEGNRYCGRTDIPLTETGIQQAQKVRHQLADVVVDAIYSSPLMRAHHTAKIAGGDRTVICDGRLIEADFGKWEGKTKEQFIEEDPAAWKSWQENPMTSKAGVTGERAADIIRRVDEFFRDMLVKHPQGNILVVGHNGINRIYLAYKLGMEVKYYRRIVQENSAITMFTLDANGEINLKLLNSKHV
jgi:alpha-ribazole phosphatase/probable phosphoglycerate mutase